MLQFILQLDVGNSGNLMQLMKQVEENLIKKDLTSEHQYVPQSAVMHLGLALNEMASE